MILDFDVEKFQIRADDEYRRERLHYSDKRGQQAWGKWGVAVSQMDTLAVTISTGELFDSNIATILPLDSTFLPAIWSFCRSREFYSAVRRIDQKVNVTNSTLVKVPFDLERWQQAAAAWEDLSQPLSPLEQVAGLYLAHQVRKQHDKK